MARKESVVLVNDLTGEDMEPDEGGTVEFGLDGQDYEIDLFEDQAAELRGALERYVAVARKVKRDGSTKPARKQSGSTRYNRETTQQIRSWARGEGWEISDRGRVPNNVVEAWEQAHPTERAA